MKKALLLFGLFVCVTKAHAANGIQTVSVIPAVSISSTPAVTGVAATVTISSPVPTSYSSGLNTYITNIHLEMFPMTALAGSASPTQCTTTNLNSLAWDFNTVQSSGTMQTMDMQFANPLIAVNPAVNTVVTCPATANVRWNMSVGYILAQ